MWKMIKVIPSIALVLLLAACNGPPSLQIDGECLTDEQCSQGYYCNDNFRCVPGDGSTIPLDGDEDGLTPTDGDTDPDLDPDQVDLPDGDDTEWSDFEPDGYDPAEIHFFYTLPPSPQGLNERIQLIAEADSEDTILYLFTVQYPNDGSEYALSEFTETSQAEWYTGFTTGTYTLHLYVKSEGSNDPKGYDNHTTLDFIVYDEQLDGDIEEDIDEDEEPSATLISLALGPEPTYVPNTFYASARAVTSDGSLPLYEFHYDPPGTQDWTLIGSGYSTDSLVYIPTNRGAGVYRVRARVKAPGSSNDWDTFRIESLTVQEYAVASIDNFLVIPDGEVHLGNSISMYANASCSDGSQPLFTYQVRRSGGSWQTLPPTWTTSLYMSYRPPQTGSYRFRVYAKCENSNPEVDYDDVATHSYVEVVSTDWPYAVIQEFEATPERISPGDTISLYAYATCSDGSYPWLQFGRTVNNDEYSFEAINEWNLFVTGQTSLNYNIYEDGDLQFAVRARCDGSQDPRGYDDVAFDTVSSGDPNEYAWLTSFGTSSGNRICRNDVVTIFATGETSDGSAPLFKYEVDTPYGEIPLMDWNTNPDFTITASYPTGFYYIYGYIKHRNSSSYDEAGILEVEIVECGDQDQDISFARFTDLRTIPSTVAPGEQTMILATASGGEEPLEYRYGMITPGSGTEAQDQNYFSLSWTTSNSYSFQAPFISGTYILFAEVRSAGSTMTEDYEETYLYVEGGGDQDQETRAYFTDFHLSSNDVNVNDIVRAYAFAEGGIWPYEYRYGILTDDGTAVYLADWGSQDTAAFSIPTAGSYTVIAEVRSLGGTQAEDYAEDYLLVRNAGDVDDDQSFMLYGVYVEPNPVMVGEPIHIWAEASESPALFQYWARAEGGSWYIINDWSTQENFVWSSLVPGTYGIRVRARSLESNQPYDDEWVGSVRVRDEANPEAVINAIWTEPESPIPLDSSFVLFIDAYSPNGVEYWLMVQDLETGEWFDIADQWLQASELEIYTGSAEGYYILRVLARDIYSSNEYDDEASLEIVISDEQICNDHNPCTEDVFTSDGRCIHPPLVGESCSDGSYCTVNDTCNANGQCVGEERSCDDHNVCTEDFCSPETNSCEYALLEGLPCDDGNLCTFNDACNPVAQCVGQERSCNDNNECTSESCNPNTGQCDSTPLVGQSCNDGDLCTINDTCGSNGQCGGSPKNCVDGNSCTEDSCNSRTGACTFTVQEGQSCDLSDPCQVNGTCQANGSCAGELRDCNDEDPCTADACDSASGGCVYSINAGASCSDDNGCTVNDLCQPDGRCEGVPRVCDDHDVCTEDICNPGTGACEGLPLSGVSCDLGSACSYDDVCQNGVCRAGTEILCDDGNPCTADSCDADTGCATTFLADETSCGLGMWCMDGLCVDMPSDCYLSCEALENCGLLGVWPHLPSPITECEETCEMENWSEDTLSCAMSTSNCDALAEDCFGLIDSDSDGVLDDEDNCPTRYNPFQENADNDSLGDVCDNCPFATNQTQRDNDGDGLGNACDPTISQAYVCADVGCGSDSDCARYGLSCDMDESLCTQSCDGNADCPAPWTCFDGMCACSGEVLECPQACSGDSQCPDSLPVCADVYGFDDLKECTAACDSDADCPSPQYECRYGSCICSTMSEDRCIQDSCADSGDCSDASMDSCLDTPEGPLCSMACGTDSDCPDLASCDAGACLCEPLPEPTCNYGSCILDDQCTTTYGSGTFCAGPWWPLNNRYCTMDCNADLDCIAVFGSSFTCEGGQCECRD